uniref:C2 tensin-type domain-containing protein n=2 Tax=Macrostomum lignano TaxID=282301 RepID=A0A1I8HJ34_9PLAT
QQRQDSRWLSIKRFHDDRLSLSTVPSQKRYVNYFAGLLSGSFRISSRAVYLDRLLLHGLPRGGDGRPMQGHYFVKVYLNLSLVHASPVQSLAAQQIQSDCLVVRVRPHLKLLGDVLIKMYFKRILTAKTWETLFRIQIPSYLVTESVITLYKQDLDLACDDPNFPASSRAELQFSWTGRSLQSGECRSAINHSWHRFRPVSTDSSPDTGGGGLG